MKLESMEIFTSYINSKYFVCLDKVQVQTVVYEFNTFTFLCSYVGMC